MFKKFAVLVLTASFAALPSQAQKRKVAVLDFGYATVRTNVAAIFGTDQDIGKGISLMLEGQLLNGGDFRLIDRSAMDKILKEQDFSNSNRADPATAAKIGGLLGVDCIIVGDITAFGSKDKHYGGVGGGVGGYAGAIGGLGYKKSNQIVEITAKIIDVNTAEILAITDGHGEAKSSGMTFGGIGAGGGKIAGGQFDMGSSNFLESDIGKAVKASVVQLATNLDAKSASLPPPSAPPVAALPPLDGLVADASTSDIIVNVGSKNGIKVGDTLAVTRVNKVINDPVTGKPLRVLEDKIGTLTLISVDPDSAVGKFAGAGAPKIGDHIKRPPTP
jgi:curli biogenesis system outer membrane secretion channel CsgG